MKKMTFKKIEARCRKAERRIIRLLNDYNDWNLLGEGGGMAQLILLVDLIRSARKEMPLEYGEHDLALSTFYIDRVEADLDFWNERIRENGPSRFAHLGGVK